MKKDIKPTLTLKTTGYGEARPAIKPLHILLVTETWSPDVNGVAMSLGQIISEIIKLGHTVSLLRPAPKPCDDAQPTLPTLLDVLAHDLHVRGIPIPRYPDMQFGMPAYLKIKSDIKKLQPDIVHIATEGPLGLATLLAAKRLGVVATTGYHTQFHDFSKHFGFGVIAKPMMTYFRWLHNASYATCVPSPKTKQDLCQLGFKRLYLVGRGVDGNRFSPAQRSDELRASWGAGQQHTVLMMVSRLSPEKGVDLVIKGFNQLQRLQLHRATKLVIVGDGPDRERLQQMTANCEDVIFTGSKSGIELAQHYASGDAFVFGSQVETFGNVVVEAMASGLPVYAFDDAAAGMLITSDCGELVNLADTEAFIDMVANLPKMQTLKSQSQVASKKVQDFSWQRPAQQMLSMFNDALTLNSKHNKHKKRIGRKTSNKTTANHI